MAKPVIYFHVGYARAESTFLQKVVFPALDGLQYIQHRNFRALASAKDRFKGEKVLISHEADGNILIAVTRHGKLSIAKSLSRFAAMIFWRNRLIA